ncbi:MAG: hypothetical protein R3316_13225, partial [Rhodovibrionaceae bacterium]|nr:hypothetical protein [Rhodovibrionaceae bacterium]
PEELLTPADAARRVLVALDAKRADIYVQVFDGCGVVQGEPAALRPELLAEYVSDSAEEGLEQAVLVAGDAEPTALAALEAAGVAATGVARQTGTPAQPNAASLAQLLASRDMPRAPAAPPRPLYLRPPDVTLPQ